MPPAPSPAPAAPAKAPIAKAPAPAPAKAAPAAPAKAAPAAKPVAPIAPPKEKDPSDYMAGEMEELDRLDKGESTPAPVPAKKKAGKPAVKPPEQPEVKPAEESEEDQELDALAKDKNETPPEEQPEEPAQEHEAPKTNPELRKALDRAQVRIKEVEPELTKAQARIKELEAREPEEVGTLRERSQHLEARNKQLEERITFLDYQSSEEFKTKYAEPYYNAYAKTLKDIEQLSIELPDGKMRRATEADMLELAQSPLGERFGKAAEMFGDAANFVLNRVEKLVELSDAQTEALTNAQKTAGERAKRMQSEAQASTAKKREMWQGVNKELSEKYPKWFAPVEGDKEGNELLAKGQSLAKRLFEPTPETAPKTPEEAVRLHALIYQKASNHDRMALRARKAEARIAELEKTIAEFEASEPSADVGRPSSGGGGADGGEDYEAEIEELSRKGPQR